MINPVNNFTDFTPKNYSINFRSNENILGLNFQPKLKTPLIKDVFEKTTSGGINGSKDSVSSVNKLFPYTEIKQFSPSQREVERNRKIEEEKKHISQLITKRTEYNSRQLRSAGISERDVKKYLTYDGHVNTEGKRILREKGLAYK